MHNSSPAVSEEAVARFDSDGFLLLEDFFTQDELDQFSPLVDAAVAHRTSDDHRPLGEKNLYEQTFTQCMGLWEDNEGVRPLTFHPRLCAAAAALLGADRVRLWHDQALYKVSGGRKTDAHMDYPFWPVDEPQLVSAWIPFDDVRHGGGVMGYVKGKSAIRMARDFMGRHKSFKGYHFWARGYFVSTVGIDEETIRQYIRNQEENDKKLDQQKLF